MTTSQKFGRAAFVVGLSLSTAVGPAFGQLATAPAPPASPGEASYREGDYDAAAGAFQKARRERPRDARAALLLGLTYLRQDDPAQAAREWWDFVRLSDDPNLKRDVNQYVTILLSEAYERSAEAAVSRERELTASRGDPRTVAVAAFQNAGTDEYAPLGKALSAMLIDNLSGLEGVKVLERDQVQALVDEAGLAESGLTSAPTAVRAGKLLRAGKIAAGSHADFESSPKRLKVAAVLVGVDDGRQLAKAEEEAAVEKFYVLVPKIASAFVPGLVGKGAITLPAQAAARVLEEHTRNLDAALAFGRVLDAKDRRDGEEAQEECKKVERLDPNFKLARRVCLLIPPVWMSEQAVANAVESQVLGATAIGSGLGLGTMIGLGALAAGGVAAAVVVASDGGGDGGGGGGSSLILTGAEAKFVRVGEVVSLDLVCRDPEGTVTSIAVDNPPQGSEFQTQSGNPATARFQWVPAPGNEGATRIRFTCLDSGTPSERITQTATISVLPRGDVPTETPLPPTTPLASATPTDTEAAALTPTPPPASPTPTPIEECNGLDSPCQANFECCSQCCSDGFCSDFSLCL